MAVGEMDQKLRNWEKWREDVIIFYEKKNVFSQCGWVCNFGFMPVINEDKYSLYIYIYIYIYI